MALVEPAHRPGESLPPIRNLDFEPPRRGRLELQKLPQVTGLNITGQPPGSPKSVYSVPPPPYSFNAPHQISASLNSGYISPPESSRRSTKEERDSPNGNKSLPSLSEALGDKVLPFTSAYSAHTPPSATQAPGSTPLSAINNSFADAPRGPLNPFSQPPPPSSQPLQQQISARDEPLIRPAFPSINTVEQRSQPFHAFEPPRSPISSTLPAINGKHPEFAGSSGNAGLISSASPFTVPRTSFTFSSQTSNPPSAIFPPSTDPFRNDRAARMEHQGHIVHPHERPYGESVKRHLEEFDVELALNDIFEASVQTENFAREWRDRSHQVNRTGYFPEALPNLMEIEDMMRHSNRITEGFSQIREVVIAQQNALSEQRARVSREDQAMSDYGMLNDDYKNYTGGDAKKRRGKAAPPGRCHSCNRAETPEWRRGPDGARTLCNACGLHYAKLTRKMGVNKAAALTGSSLRPKGLEPNMTTQM